MLKHYPEWSTIRVYKHCTGRAPPSLWERVEKKREKIQRLTEKKASEVEIKTEKAKLRHLQAELWKEDRDFLIREIARAEHYAEKAEREGKTEERDKWLREADKRLKELEEHERKRLRLVR